ncbi:cation:proton antiporter regulatory subunit [Lactococcus lactis]
MDVPKHWIGKSLMELNLRRKLGLNIIAIKNSGSVNVVPEPEEHFRENDVIVVVGRQSTIIEYIQE